jgi:hypothetical protein
MSATHSASRGMRSISLSLCWLLLLPSLTHASQAPQVTALKIVVLEGEGAINNIKQRTAREPIVQVEDENHKPVAGALVLFTLPDSGPSGVFPGGSKTLMVYTDAQGRAAGKGLQPNKNAGQFQIAVNATYKGLTTSTTISQSNALVGAAAAAGISGKLMAILAIAGGAAVAGAIAASTRGNNNTPVPPTTITPGAPSVSGP